MNELIKINFKKETKEYFKDQIDNCGILDLDSNEFHYGILPETFSDNLVIIDFAPITDVITEEWSNASIEILEKEIELIKNRIQKFFNPTSIQNLGNTVADFGSLVLVYDYNFYGGPFPLDDYDLKTRFIGFLGELIIQTKEIKCYPESIVEEAFMDSIKPENRKYQNHKLNWEEWKQNKI